MITNPTVKKIGDAVRQVTGTIFITRKRSPEKPGCADFVIE